MQLSCAKGGARRGGRRSWAQQESGARCARSREFRRWCSLRPAGLHNLDYFALSPSCEKQPSGPGPSASDATRRPGVGLYVCQVNTLTLTMALTPPLSPYSHRWHKNFIARRMRPVVVEVQISLSIHPRKVETEKNNKLRRCGGGVKNCDFDDCGGPLWAATAWSSALICLSGRCFWRTSSRAAATLSRSAMCCSREVRSAPTWRHVRCGQPSASSSFPPVPDSCILRTLRCCPHEYSINF